MKTLNLTIPNMKSSHCQMTVTRAVNAIGGNVRSVSPGKVEIDLVNGLAKETVVNAIQSVGYRVD